MHTIKLLLSFTLAIAGLANAMQEKLSITDLPKEAIQHITGFIDDKYDRSYFARTCRYLNNSVATKDKKIKINCFGKRFERAGESLPVRQLLNQLFVIIQHVVARNGNNPIKVYLNSNHLVDDLNAVSDFLTLCSRIPVSQYITTLDFSSNHMACIPKEIGGLPNLKRLDLFMNGLAKKDLVVLEKIINESLKKLRTVDLRGNKSITIQDVFQTIAHCVLHRIGVFCSQEADRSYQPTVTDLADCKTQKIFLMDEFHPMDSVCFRKSV